jgi:hypothetical protein
MPETRRGPVTYTGRHTPGGTEVLVRDDAAGSSAPLRHVVRHSPTGFGWGYGGSGPADLARSLLIDALGPAALCPQCNGTHRVVWLGPETDHDPVPFHEIRHAEADPELITDCLCDDGIRSLPYHDFKFAVVAGWPQDEPWSITRAEIIDWLTTLYPPGDELPEWLQDVVAGALP